MTPPGQRIRFWASRPAPPPFRSWVPASPLPHSRWGSRLTLGGDRGDSRGAGRPPRLRGRRAQGADEGL